MVKILPASGSVALEQGLWGWDQWRLHSGGSWFVICFLVFNSFEIIHILCNLPCNLCNSVVQFSGNSIPRVAQTQPVYFRIFLSPRRSHTPCQHFLTCIFHQSLATSNLLSVSIDLLFCIFQIKGIIWYVILCEQAFFHLASCFQDLFML